MKKKHRTIATHEAYTAFQNALNAFNADTLESEVTAPADIFRYYEFVDPMYTWLKNAYDTELTAIENEMRAALGHMSEYEMDASNLSKAYGHIRRLSIDALKILCNGFDLEFDEWIQMHSAYDYSRTDNQYFPEYAVKYNEAHKKYLEVQQKENLGSNKNNGIIKAYCEAAALYGELYAFHINPRREDIHRAYLWMHYSKKIGFAVTVVVTALSVISYFISSAA